MDSPLVLLYVSTVGNCSIIGFDPCDSHESTVCGNYSHRSRLLFFADFSAWHRGMVACEWRITAVGCGNTSADEENDGWYPCPPVISLLENFVSRTCKHFSDTGTKWKVFWVFMVQNWAQNRRNKSAKLSLFVTYRKCASLLICSWFFSLENGT